jgi:hypothetical protein
MDERRLGGSALGPGRRQTKVASGPGDRPGRLESGTGRDRVVRISRMDRRVPK